MIERRLFADIGGTQRDWLTAKHHFALGKYGNADHLPVGCLYVWNDDALAPRSGFPFHRHADVEIITYVREGIITHEDGLGNRSRIIAGDVQVMSAGTGIEHSERNNETEPARIFQIWLHPRRGGSVPTWDTQHFPRAERAGRLVLLASGRGLEEALKIGADADVYGAQLGSGDEVELDIPEGSGGYLVPAVGSVNVNGVLINAGDGVALRDERHIKIIAQTDAEFVLVVAGLSDPLPH